MEPKNLEFIVINPTPAIAPVGDRTKTPSSTEKHNKPEQKKKKSLTSPEEKRDKSVIFRVTPSERERLEILSGESEISDYIRSKIFADTQPILPLLDRQGYAAMMAIATAIQKSQRDIRRALKDEHLDHELRQIFTAIMVEMHSIEESASAIQRAIMCQSPPLSPDEIDALETADNPDDPLADADDFERLLEPNLSDADEGVR